MYSANYYPVQQLNRDVPVFNYSLSRDLNMTFIPQSPYLGLGRVMPINRGAGINQKLLLDFAR
jgi:hypothetical protein